MSTVEMSYLASPQAAYTSVIPSSTGVAPNGNNTSAITKPGSGTSQSDKIALGVGIGVGIPTVVVALIAWWFPRDRRPNHAASHETADPVVNRSTAHVDPNTKSHPSEGSGKLSSGTSNV
jgi:hypothetical protein